MYSYEDRIRAVELHIRLGKRVRVTIRQLGYPTKNSLKSWHAEYERRLNLPRGYVRSKPWVMTSSGIDLKHRPDCRRRLRMFSFSPSRKLHLFTFLGTLGRRL